MRASTFVQELAGSILKLAQEELDCLVEACRDHTHGYTVGDITVMTCWDADRPDLGRAGIIPGADLLCTEVARNPATIEWAYKRSIKS